MQRLQVTHLTQYDFTESVTLEPHRLMLRPREGHEIRIQSSKLRIAPAHSLRWSRDVYDNSVTIVEFQEPATRLRILSEIILEHYEETPLDFIVAGYAVNYPFDYKGRDEADLKPYQQSNYPDDRFRVSGWLRESVDITGTRETYVLLDEINRCIAGGLTYTVREEAGVQSPEQTLDKGSGSCRDYATLFMEACKQLGLASRFVSGYLHAPATEVGNASTHAWAEVYLPGPGWKGFDPTLGELTGNRHIPVAVARHPEWVPPVSGSYIGTAQTPVLTVDVQVSAL